MLKMSVPVSILSALATLACLTPSVAHAVGAPVFRSFVASTGNDVNPCSRTQPCRTFGAAQALTMPSGEIIVLDSAGYGGTTLTKAISVIAPSGVYASVTTASGDAITVNAGDSDVVVIRGLVISAQPGGGAGIILMNAKSVHIEDTQISNFSVGIANQPLSAGSDPLRLYLSNTTLRDNFIAGASFVTMPGSKPIVVTVDHSRFENSLNGFMAQGNVKSYVVDSVASGNTQAGFVVNNDIIAFSSPTLTLKNCLVVENGTGIQAGQGMPGSSIVRVSGTTITGNTTGLSTGVLLFGQILSFGNNDLAGNGTDGTFNTNLGQQ